MTASSKEKMDKINSKREFIRSLSQDNLNNGCILFDLPGEYEFVKIHKKKVVKNKESAWGWVTPEDKIKYLDDNFYGEITAVLLTDPLMNLEHLLLWGSEVILQCRGSERPILSSKWLYKYIYKI